MQAAKLSDDIKALQEQLAFTYFYCLEIESANQ
jgi:hypothetical protein